MRLKNIKKIFSERQYELKSGGPIFTIKLGFSRAQEIFNFFRQSKKSKIFLECVKTITIKILKKKFMGTVSTLTIQILKVFLDTMSTLTIKNLENFRWGAWKP